MKSLIIAGIIFFSGSIILITKNLNKLDIEKKGKIVSMQIEKLPASCIGAKVRYFVSFKYKGVVYDKAVRGAFCEDHHIGEFMDIKMLEGESHVLFPTESVLYDLLSFAALGLFGFSLSLFQIIKYRKAKRGMY